VLVTGSALLIRSFDRLTPVNPAVTLNRVVSGRIAVPAACYATPARRLQFAGELVARLEERADIESAALTSFVPADAGGFGVGRSFLAEGRPDDSELNALWNTVTPHYFQTMGIPIVEGRSIRGRRAEDRHASSFHDHVCRSLLRAHDRRRRDDQGDGERGRIEPAARPVTLAEPDRCHHEHAAQPRLHARRLLLWRAACPAEAAAIVGQDPLEIGRAAIMGQMTTGFPLSPLTPSTFILLGLSGVSLRDHQRFVFIWAFGTTVVMTIVGSLTRAI
jgi:hypothetical protein